VFALLLCTTVLLCACSDWTRFLPQKSTTAETTVSEPTTIPEPTATATPEPTPEPTPQVATVDFSATGDNLIHQLIYQQAAARAGEGEKYSFDYCYENLVPFYAGFDVNWINQETLCNNELEPSTYPCFSTPGECAEALYRAGIRVFSLSNNHTYDKGSKGIAATLRFWDSMPEDVVTTGLWQGEEDYDTIPLQTVNGVTIAYLSYTEHTNGIPQSSSMEANVIYTSQTDVIERQVKRAAELADFVVVGTHWGVEDSHTITQAQRTLAQQLADWGADVIVGTHPHVIQDAEWLTAEDGRKTFVAYSLGNFISTQKHKDQLIGAILTLQLQKVTDPDGTVTLSVCEPKLHPTVTHYDSGKANVRTYLFRDYTQELASKHGVRATYSDFNYDYIQSTAEKYISAEFLSLD
jgi:poly-gamma-glutamate synthesis protein (capsule biosynthesis protein)